jgi:hypothetical protein
MEFGRRDFLSSMGLVAIISSCNHGFTKEEKDISEFSTPYGRLDPEIYLSALASANSQTVDSINHNSVVVKSFPWHGVIVKSGSETCGSINLLEEASGWWRTSFACIKDPIDPDISNPSWGLGLDFGVVNGEKVLISAIYLTENSYDVGGENIQTWVSKDAVEWSYLGNNFDFNISSYEDGWFGEAKLSFFNRFKGGGHNEQGN